MFSDKADMLFLNGKIITVDSKETIAEAVAIKGNIILKVGNKKELEKLIDKDTQVIDLDGKTMLPGFIDSHTHSERYARFFKNFISIHVPPLKSVKDALGLLKKKAQEVPKGEWILGQGSFFLWHKYKEKRLPTKAELDAVSRDHPIAIKSGGHITVMNSKAFEMAGITKDTPKHAKHGGRMAVVEKDPVTGEPTGMLREYSLPIPTFIDEEALRDTLNREFVQQGVTSLGDLPGLAAFKIYQKWVANNELPLRIRVYFGSAFHGGTIDPIINLTLQKGFGNDWLRIGGIKLFMDGGISGLGALLYQPYPDDVYKFGLQNYSQEEFTQLFIKIHKANLQIWTHVTGEKSQDMVLNAIEASLHEYLNKDHRHRLEHAGNVFATEERMQRMLELGAIPSPQPMNIHAIGFTLEQSYGKRVKKTLYPFRMILDMGFKLPFNSDATGSQPEGTNPFWGIWCAVKRETFDGSILNPEQRISVMEAIRCYTLYSAYADFEENVKGSIEPGKLADLIIVSEDPLTVPVDEIKDIKVTMTIIDGKIVYKNKKWYK